MNGSVIVIAAVLCGGGIALILHTVLARARSQAESLRQILDLPFGENDVPVAEVSEHTAVYEGAVGLAGRVVDSFDEKGGLSTALERAAIPLRPGEYVVITSVAALVAAVVLAAITSTWIMGVLGVGLVVGGAWKLPELRQARRRRAFAEQLPDALSLIASSLSAGHTFLRAVQLMVQEAEAPLSEEFARVIHETRLGDPLVDALERMSVRVGLKDLYWMVQAIRVQQTVGGKLADLLHTLTDFIRAREEVRREVQVLTAEGRISAWILAALPVLLLISIQVSSPTYLSPLFHGWGLAVLLATGLSVVVGTGVILRMVKIEV